MKRSVANVKVGETQVRWKVRIEAEPVIQDSQESWESQQRLLQDLVSQPHLLHCGPSRFQKMAMYHNGSCWVVEVEAVTDN